jgi:hypothetical protein
MVCGINPETPLFILQTNLKYNPSLYGWELTHQEILTYVSLAHTISSLPHPSIRADIFLRINPPTRIIQKHLNYHYDVKSSTTSDFEGSLRDDIME